MKFRILYTLASWFLIISLINLFYNAIVYLYAEEVETFHLIFAFCVVVLAYLGRISYKLSSFTPMDDKEFIKKVKEVIDNSTY